MGKLFTHRSVFLNGCQLQVRYSLFCIDRQLLFNSQQYELQGNSRITCLSVFLMNDDTYVLTITADGRVGALAVFNGLYL